MKKQALFVDAGPLLTERLSGIGHLTLGMLRALQKRPDVQQDYKIVLLAPMAKAYLLDRWHLQGIHVKRIPLLARIWNNWPRFSWLPPIDLFLGKGLYIFPNYKRWPLAFSPSITYVHDISFKLFPQFTEPRNLAMLANVPRWMAKSTRVITDSQTSKQEILAHYKITQDKIKVVYCGVDGGMFQPAAVTAVNAVRKKYGLTKPYLFFLSNLEPRKNIITLIAALRQLPKDYKERYALLMVGGMSWQNAELMQAIDGAKKEGWTIIKPDAYVPDEDLPALLTGAQALVHPALHEGFGIPPVEAMACGTPVVLSDIPVLHEIADDAALYADPHDATALAAVIQRILQDKALRQELATKGKRRAAIFTWDAAAESLVRYIKEINGRQV